MPHGVRRRGDACDIFMSMFLEALGLWSKSHGARRLESELRHRGTKLGSCSSSPEVERRSSGGEDMPASRRKSNGSCLLTCKILSTNLAQISSYVML